jgi:hypothetical protein
MLIVLLLALGVGVLTPAGWMLHTLWSAIPRSNADFEWLDL